MSAGGKGRVTLVLAALTVFVLALSVPGSLREVWERGGFYIFSREFLEDLPKRLFGPGRFRFLLQPAVAVFFAIRDGRRDAREGRPPYFWGLFTDKANRRDMLQSGWKSVSKVFLIAIVLDLVFQVIALHAFHPVGALIAGVILAIIPYLLLRGPINRLTRPKQKEA